MADEDLVFPVEKIPDADSVYLRAHRNNMNRGQLGLGVFRAKGGGMSVDWERYSSPQSTRERGAQSPDNYAVIQLNVGGIREIKALDVLHTPEPLNRAHSDVNLPEKGEDLTEIRLSLGRIATIVIPLEP